MDPEGPKDNANPTIRQVDTKERSHSRRTPFEWSQLGTFTKEYDSPTAAWIPNSAEDQAILQALTDISKTTHGKGVKLLENVGLSLTAPQPQVDIRTSFPNLRLSSEETKTDVSSPTAPTSSTTQQYKRRDKFDAEEVYDIIRNIQDPEHPHTLEELGVVSLSQVQVVDEDSSPEGWDESPQSLVHVRFTPTIPHCSMATLIGLCLRVKLLRSLPARFKISVQIEPGTHASEKAINKQLRDKERVCAALENKHLAGVVNKCIKHGMESH